MRVQTWLQIILYLNINIFNVLGLLLHQGVCQKVNDTIYFLGSTKLVGSQYLFPNTRIYNLDLSKGFDLEKDNSRWETIYDGDKGLDNHAISAIYIPESQDIMTISKWNGKNTTINYYNIPENRWIPDQKASNAFDKFVNNMNKDLFHIYGSMIIRNEINKDEFFVAGGVIIFPETEMARINSMKLNIKNKVVNKLELSDEKSLDLANPFIISYNGALYYFSYLRDNINSKRLTVYNYTNNEINVKDIKGDHPQLQFFTFFQVENLVYFVVTQIDSKSKTLNDPIEMDPSVYVLNLDSFSWERNIIRGFTPYESNCFIKHNDHLLFFNSNPASGEDIQIIDTKKWKKVTKLPSKEELLPSPEINKKNDTKNKNESTVLDIDKIVLIVLGSLLGLALLIILAYFIYSKYSKDQLKPPEVTFTPEWANGPNTYDGTIDFQHTALSQKSFTEDNNNHLPIYQLNSPDTNPVVNLDIHHKKIKQ